MALIEKNSPLVGKGNRLVEDLGLETFGGRFTVLIKRGATVPCAITQILSTAADNQRVIDLSLYRGVGQYVRQARCLGRFRVSGLPEAPRGVPQIMLTFRVLASKDILLEAMDGKTGEALAVAPVKEEEDWDS